MVLRSIAGRENQPAESVFKNIKILKGVPAGRLVNIMNMGFGRSLGVSCGFCHVPGKWDLDDKEEKNTARLMFAMVQTINRDYISKVPVDSGKPAPTVNCMTCHRGMPRPMGPGGPPPDNILLYVRSERGGRGRRRGGQEGEGGTESLGTGGEKKARAGEERGGRRQRGKPRAGRKRTSPGDRERETEAGKGGKKRARGAPGSSAEQGRGEAEGSGNGEREGTRPSGAPPSTD